MLKQHQFFRDNGFLLVQNVFTPNECYEVTQRMFKHCENGVLEDSQCPKSEGVYGLFDDYLYPKKDIFEKSLGLSLHPTYTYTRIYRPGELLAIHTDRESCEITASVTISFEGNSIWPIYLLERPQSFKVFDKYSKASPSLQYYEVDTEDFKNQICINIEVGDAGIFRGQEILHWRREYTQGKWQIQMFLHYVDANGPLAEFKWDKRESLGIENKGRY